MVGGNGKGRLVGGVGVLPVLKEDSEGESTNDAGTGTLIKSQLETQTTGMTAISLCSDTIEGRRT